MKPILLRLAYSQLMLNVFEAIFEPVVADNKLDSFVLKLQWSILFYNWHR